MRDRLRHDPRHRPLSLPAKREIFRQTRDDQIIQRKGATYYAVAASVMRITEAILRNQNTVLSISSLVQNLYAISDVSLSLPIVVNRTGIANLLRIQLSEKEVDQLRQSAAVLKRTTATLHLAA